MTDIVTFLPGILLAYSAYLLSILSPGPNILAIMGTSMSVGRRQGCALAMGISTGSFIWAMLTASGLSVILTQYAFALTAIKIAGGCYLLWLSYKAFKSAARHSDVAAATMDVKNKNMHAFYLRGLAVQLTNPKAVLAWIAIMSLGLGPNAPLWVAAAIVIGTCLFAIIIHLIYAVIFSSKPMIALYQRARRGIQAILGVFFAAAGIKLLASET